MSRNDKGLALARYVTGRTGIVGCSWDGGHSRIIAPYPYHLDVTTSRKLQNWHDLIRSYPDGGNVIHAAIRYDREIDNVAGAWVGMRLAALVPLLQVYNDSITMNTEGR